MVWSVFTGTYVWLVDAHSERDGGADNRDGVGRPVGLHLRAYGGRQSGVIVVDQLPVTCVATELLVKLLGHLFAILFREAVCVDTAEKHFRNWILVNKHAVASYLNTSTHRQSQIQTPSPPVAGRPGAAEQCRRSR